MTAPSPSAVFVSYAREDSDAARRIAEALRSHGLEVWLDQDELRGADAWDKKLRRQIKECALFVPVVSANTQERREGYFRLEWKLAAERTHLMAEGVPFIAPVVIDETKEGDALVPAEFMRVQWTRLPGARVTPEFAEQVKRLLAPRAPAMETGRPRPVQRGEGAASPTKAPVGRRVPAAAWGLAFAGVLAVVVIVALQMMKNPNAGAGTRPPTTEISAAPATPAISAKSIAVLPFGNLSPDKENEFFADGIHEDVLTNLQNIRELRVVSRTSVLGYRGTTKKIPEIARELGVAYILEGSVRRAGDTVRISAQLIDARTDTHVWSPQPYTRKLTDIFAIQTEIAQAIASALHTALSPQEKILLDRKPTENLAAYDLYLKSKTSGSTRNNRESLLESAVLLDPGFVKAWCRLSELRIDDYFFNRDRTAAQLARAKEALDAAVRLAPDLPDTLLSQGNYYLRGYRDYVRAMEYFERVARLQPNDPEATRRIAAVQARRGQWADALVNARKSAQLDPTGAVNAWNLTFYLQVAKRYAEAMAERRREWALQPEAAESDYRPAWLHFFATGSTREMDEFLARVARAQPGSARETEFRKRSALLRGDFAEAIRLDRLQPYADVDEAPRWSQALAVALALAAQGDPAGARARLENFPAELRARLELEPSDDLLWSGLAQMEMVLGHDAEALRCARKGVELVPESLDANGGPARSIALATVQAWTGDKERAVAEVARLLRTPNGLNVHVVKFGAAFFPLRGDPRFEALLNDPKNNAPLF